MPNFIQFLGLGRYGDFLNPFGDVIAISKAWYYYYFRTYNQK
jgi:hypothetical protein